MNIHRLLVFVVLVLIFPGCQQSPMGPQLLTEADTEQIAALMDAHVNEVFSNDASEAATPYLEDAIFLPQGAPILRGKSEIRKMYEDSFRQEKVVQFELAAEEVSGVDGVAYEVGNFRMTVERAEDTNPVPNTGKYLVVFKKSDDGEWKFAVVIGNGSELPPVTED